MSFSEDPPAPANYLTPNDYVNKQFKILNDRISKYFAENQPLVGAALNQPYTHLPTYPGLEMPYQEMTLEEAFAAETTSHSLAAFIICLTYTLVTNNGFGVYEPPQEESKPFADKVFVGIKRNSVQQGFSPYSFIIGYKFKPTMHCLDNVVRPTTINLVAGHLTSQSFVEYALRLFALNNPHRMEPNTCMLSSAMVPT